MQSEYQRPLFHKAILIQEENHLLEVCRYVVLNPVRAGVVEQPEDWQWSSYRGTAGREKTHPCLTTDWILGQLSGKRTRAEKAYRQFVQVGMGKTSIWTEVKGQTLLGDDEFVYSLKDHLKKHKDVPEIPKSQRYVNRPSLNQIFQEGIKMNKLKRDKKIVEALVKYGYLQVEIASYLGMHYSTISNLLKGNR